MNDKKIIYVLLVAAIIFGIFLRCQNIDFPTMGYHNMKENEYVQEAIHMVDNGDYIHRKTFTFFGLTDNNNFDEYAQPPILAWMMVPFDADPLAGRIIIILFSAASIAMMFFVTRKLTRKDSLSLISAFLFAIMPISVFFGRNIQPEMPGLFFVLLSLFFFLDWAQAFDISKEKKKLFYAMLSMSISCLFKETYLIMLLPMLFIVPWKKVMKDKKEAGIAIAGLIPFFLVIKFFDYLIVDRSRIQMESFVIAFKRAFDVDFWFSVWPAISSFLRDNFTMWYVMLALIGLVLVATKYKTTLGRYAIGTFITLIIYSFIVSGKIAGHSYYHMPFLPIICILSAYVMYLLGHYIQGYIPQFKIVLLVAILVILCTYPAIEQANDRVFGTNFYGQDVAGEWINQRIGNYGRFFAMATSQEYAVCTYAKSYCGEWRNESDMKFLEEKYNIDYLYVSAYRMGQLQTNPAFEYILNNYHVAYAGLLVVNNQPNLYHIILEKGGSLDMNDINNMTLFRERDYNGIVYVGIEK